MKKELKNKTRIKQDAKISTKNSRSSRVSQRRLAFTRKRKNFLPTLLLALLFWAGWGWLVYSQPPANNLILFGFYSLLFLALFLTAALILANSRRGFLFATAAIIFLIFRYYQLANPLNLVLLLGILIALELYCHQK